MTSLVGLSSACLIEPNPGFALDTDSEENTASASATATTETGAETSSTQGSTEENSSATDEDDCDPGTLDCDDDGECETEESLDNCGECGRECEYEGAESLICEAGECVASVFVVAEADVTIVEDEPSEAPGSERLYAGGEVDREALLRFPPPEVPEGGTPTAAELHLYSFNVTAAVDLLFNDGPWEEDTVEWPGPLTTETGIEFVPSAEIIVPFDACLSWFVTDDPRPNHGVRVSNTNVSNNVTEFASRETDMDERRPRLKIELRW